MSTPGVGIAASKRNTTSAASTKRTRARNVSSLTISFNFLKNVSIMVFYAVIEPPTFSIAARTCLETAIFFSRSFFVTRVFPIIFTSDDTPTPRMSPFSRSVRGVTSSPALNAFSTRESKTTFGRGRVATTPRLRFLPHPRSFGSRLIISRHSGRIFAPARAVCPLPPRPDCFPRVDDCPLPTRRYARFMPEGLCNSCSCIRMCQLYEFIPIYEQLQYKENDKLQIPNSKFQTIPKFQIPMSQTHSVLCFEFWSLWFVCDLVLGIWCFL